MSGKLTTHVLDIMHGQPARGMTVALWTLSDNDRAQLTSAITNADGRLDAPLLAAPNMRVGRYELLFHVGDYFAQFDRVAGGPPFLDIVPVRFQISDADASYHVPLLVSPWAYSTYRGS